MGYRTGPNNIYVQQQQSIVEIAKRRDILRKCAVYQDEFITWTKTSSSAEEDKLDYDKNQSFNNKKEGDFIYVTLMVNNVPIKCIIGSGSPATLTPQRIFNNITKVEKTNINYKDVNDNKVEFVGQTKATLRMKRLQTTII